MISVVVAFAFLPGYRTALAASESAAADRPNVLLIVVDDLRPQLGAYGFDAMHTPNIDTLADRGTVFRRAYNQWPVCGPSRASMMSGLRPDSSGVYYIGTPLRSKAPDIVTLPQYFRSRGYRTLSVGKVYHGGGEDQEAWSEPSWDIPQVAQNWQGYASQESRNLRNRLLREALARRPEAQLWEFNAAAVERADLPENRYRDGMIADQAVKLLRENAGQPFFLAVGFVKPHLPFAAPARYWDLYDPDDLRPMTHTARPAGTTDIPYLFKELQAYHAIPEDMDLPEDLVLELIHGYLACVSFIDALVGRLMGELARLELTDDTIVALVGDHGFHLGEQGIWAKHSLFERSLHTPLIVSAPGAESAGAGTDALVELVDIYPSLAELAGLPAPPGVDGRSFVPLLDDPDLSWKDVAFSQYQSFLEPYRNIMGYSVRTERYRYTEWRDRGKENAIYARELYDLGISASETVNVAHDPEYAKVLAQMSARIEGQAVFPGVGTTVPSTSPAARAESKRTRPQ